AALTRGLDGLERELATWLPLEGGVVRVGMGRKQTGPHRRRVRGDTIERACGDALGVVVTELRSLARKAERGTDEHIDVVELFGEVGGLDERLAELGLAGLSLHGSQFGEDCGALVFVGRHLAVDEFEGLVVPADGVIGRERIARRVARTP